MMSHRTWRAGAVLCTLLFSLWPAAAVADTYALKVVGGDDQTFVAGDDFGDYTIDLLSTNGSPQSPCGPGAGTCYKTFYAATGTTAYSESLPTLPADPKATAGSGCVAKPSDFTGSMWCSNGHQMFGGVFDLPNGKVYQGTFDGPDPLTDMLEAGVADGPGVMSANGNFYFDDATNDNLVVAIDLTTAPTPEPSGLALAGTGALAVLEAVRRKRKNA